MSAFKIIEKIREEVNNENFDAGIDGSSEGMVVLVYSRSHFADFKKDDFISWLADELEDEGDYDEDDYEDYYKKLAQEEWDKTDKKQGLPTEGKIWKEACEDYLDETFDYFEDQFYANSTFVNGKVEVYRCITVESIPRFIHHLEKGKSIPGQRGMGIYWSWDKEAAECHWGSGDQNVIILTALVDPNDIDYRRTAQANMHPTLGEAEREITIEQGKSITVTKVETDKGSAWKGTQVVKAVTNMNENKMKTYLLAALKSVVETKLKTFVTDCRSANGDSINEMKEDSEDIDYEDFIEEVGKEEFEEFVQDSFPQYDNMDEWEKDWHIGYSKGEYEGKECVYFTHSGIEFIFC